VRRSAPKNLARNGKIVIGIDFRKLALHSVNVPLSIFALSGQMFRHFQMQ
jgi:hypothetical protein